MKVGVRLATERSARVKGLGFSMLRCSAGLGFRVQLLVCSAALLGQRPERRLRRGATLRVEIHRAPGCEGLAV